MYTNQEGSLSVQNVSIGINLIEIFKSDYNTQIREILVYPIVTSSYEVKLESGIGKDEYPFDKLGCSIIIIIFSIFALLGSISSFQRKNFNTAAAGALIAIFSFGFLLIGSILSIIALAIIMMTREEFEDGKKGKIF
jgi:hypothetical protein